jgi:hypothetical protein
VSEPVLCYVEGAKKAYFTTASLGKQWGDDWGDSPYFCNAGEPYAYRPGVEPYEIHTLFFDADLDTPEHDRWYSVEQINSGVTPWLKESYKEGGIEIWAGTTLSEFRHLIRRAGGEVYVKETS